MKKNIVKYLVGNKKALTFASSNKRQADIDIFIPDGLKEAATCLGGIETPLKRNVFIINKPRKRHRNLAMYRLIA